MRRLRLDAQNNSRIIVRRPCWSFGVTNDGSWFNRVLNDTAWRITIRYLQCCFARSITMHKSKRFSLDHSVLHRHLSQSHVSTENAEREKVVCSPRSSCKCNEDRSPSVASHRSSSDFSAAGAQDAEPIQASHRDLKGSGSRGRSVVQGLLHP